MAIIQDKSNMGHALVMSFKKLPKNSIYNAL